MRGMTLPLPSKRLTAIPGDEGDGWGVYYRALELPAAGERVTPLTIGEVKPSRLSYAELAHRESTATHAETLGASCANAYAPIP